MRVTVKQQCIFALQQIFGSWILNEMIETIRDIKFWQSSKISKSGI